MKKIFPVLAMLFFTFSLYSQQVDRDQVVVEIGTGTW